MTLTLTWLCDECEEARASKTADDPTFLSIPAGWTWAPEGDGFRYACPSCADRGPGRRGSGEAR